MGEPRRPYEPDKAVGGTECGGSGGKYRNDGFHIVGVGDSGECREVRGDDKIANVFAEYATSVHMPVDEIMG